MNARKFLSLATDALKQEADEMARNNGANRYRSIEEVRFISGWVNGLLAATAKLDELYQSICNDEE